ncbi:MAG: hypothetical protein LQ350_007106 [Teloschistes chrysophthalmus]|nr:MAG: hypothetical protein LQ350_007106 [Niorma chrysophthalma]
MFNFQSITLLTLVTAVLSQPTIRSLNKRQLTDPHAQVIFRSDLKDVAQGQSAEFKNLLLSTTPSNASTGYDISFVNIAETASAYRTVLESKGMPIGVSANTTLEIVCRRSCQSNEEYGVVMLRK